MVGFVQSIPSAGGEAYSLTGLKATCFYGVKGDSPAQAEVTPVEPKAAPKAAAKQKSQSLAEADNGIFEINA